MEKCGPDRVLGPPSSRFDVPTFADRVQDRVPVLEMPTLVVWGERDRVFPCSQARQAVAHIRGGSLSLIPDCGHLPHVECPQPFVAALDRFLG